MLKLSRLYLFLASALLCSLVAKADNFVYRITGDTGLPTVFSHGTENVTINYGADFTWKIENKGNGVVYMTSANDAKYSKGDGNTSDEVAPSRGDVFAFTPKSDGTLAVKIVYRNLSKKGVKFVAGDGTPVELRDVPSDFTDCGNGLYEISTSEQNKGKYIVAECAFDVVKDRKYYVFGRDTKLCVSGYTFTPASGAAAETFAYETTTVLPVGKVTGMGVSPADAPTVDLFLGNGSFIKGVTPTASEDVVKGATGALAMVGADVIEYNGNTDRYLPTEGIYYVIAPGKKGTLNLTLDIRDKGKVGTIWIVCADNVINGRPVPEYSHGFTATNNNNNDLAFRVEEGKKYYIFNNNTTGSSVKTVARYGIVKYSLATENQSTNKYVVTNGEKRTVGDKIVAPDIVMTFGGYDETTAQYELPSVYGFDAYGVAKQDDAYLTSTKDDEISNYSYFVSGKNDAYNEQVLDKGNTKKTAYYFQPEAATVNTHSLPIYGTYYKFEPKKAGTLKVFVLQNGAMNIKEDGTGLLDNKLKHRPLYIADERGCVISAKAWATTGKYKSFGNDWNQDKNYELYKDYMNLNEGAALPVLVYDAEAKTIVTQPVEGGKYGYLTLQKGYCKYEFDVKPGKTYFVMTNGSCLGFCGFDFAVDGTQTESAFEIDDTRTIQDIQEATHVKVSSSTRTLKAGVWASVVLPYSMTEEQVKATFGEGTEVIYFDGIEGSTIKFKKHFYQMIVAGEPCIVKPVDGGNFVIPEGTPGYVTVEAPEITYRNGVKEAPCSAGITGACTFALNASYGKQESALRFNDYYFGGDGVIYRTLEGQNFSINGYRAFFDCSTNDPASKVMLTGMIVGNGESTPTSIGTYTMDMVTGSTDIYNLNGQKVGSGISALSGLSKGIYIMNGKKYTVK